MTEANIRLRHSNSCRDDSNQAFYAVFADGRLYKIEACCFLYASDMVVDFLAATVVTSMDYWECLDNPDRNDYIRIPRSGEELGLYIS